jgi:hypothetical protein
MCAMHQNNEKTAEVVVDLSSRHTVGLLYALQQAHRLVDAAGSRLESAISADHQINVARGYRNRWAGRVKVSMAM